MCPTFVFIPSEIAGYPVFGAGLLLAVWAVVSVVLLAFQTWRHGWNADTLGYVPLLLLIGAIIYWVLPAISEPEGLPIRGFGVMNMLGVIAGTGLVAWRAKRVGIHPDVIFSLAFWMLLPGIVGARAFYVIEYWPEYARVYTAPGGGLGPFLAYTINVTKGGLVIYGALFGGLIGAVWFLRKHRLPLLAMADLVAPGMVLGLAFGRVGCLMRGCCYGALCAYPWAITFPAGTPPDYAPAYRAQIERGQMYGFSLSEDPEEAPCVLEVAADSPAARAGLKPGDCLQSLNGYEIAAAGQAAWVLEQAFAERLPLEIKLTNGSTITISAIEPPARSLPVHPTQIYSIFDALGICLVLLAVDRYRRRDGVLFALMLTIYPVSRFIIEWLRTDEAPVFGTGLSISQNVSIGLLVCAVALWFYILRQPKGTSFPLQPSARRDAKG